MSNVKSSLVKKSLPEFTGDMRKVLANTMMAVLHGEIKESAADRIIASAKEMNVSLYSEIKYMALLAQLSREIPELGSLPMFRGKPAVEGTSSAEAKALKKA